MIEHRFPLSRESWRDEQTHVLPRVEVRVGESDQAWGAVVDTGAAVTVIDVEVLRAAGWTEDELKQGDDVSVAGVKGSAAGRLFELTLRVGDLTLREVPCVVLEGVNDAVLLGQCRALELLVFEQHGPDEQGALRLED